MALDSGLGVWGCGLGSGFRGVSQFASCTFSFIDARMQLSPETVSGRKSIFFVERPRRVSLSEFVALDFGVSRSLGE